ncbi:6182_t:CDS:2 [Funneliformis geosporum]|uniref:6182_t:CDS:1 n=1 Tax=Funneliformis geosporum TaxID=1117311 RepID=A0A9W4WPZ9_9GLOM|nr:6182_t:CDS:2 [Funneliformis geosporum]
MQHSKSEVQSSLATGKRTTTNPLADVLPSNSRKRPAPSQSPDSPIEYESPGSTTLPAPPLLRPVAPRSPTRGGNRSVPAFLNKLYNMVNDPQSNDLITWSEAGNSFLVKRPQDFAKEVLPRFFKHNNFSSFVRQLNMYGFHKIPHLQQGVLQSDGQSEQWEFSNTNFIRNQPDLLYYVTRKKGKDTENIKEPNEVDINHILNEIASVKKHQMTISADLKNIQRDNQILWQETMSARDRHRRQQETIDKILRFLASVFSADKKRAIVPKKRRLLLGNSDTDYGNQDVVGSSEQRNLWTAGNDGQTTASPNSSPNEADASCLVLDINNPAALSLLASLAINDPSSTNMSQFDIFNSLPSLSSDGINTDFLNSATTQFSNLLQSDQILNQISQSDPSSLPPPSTSIPNNTLANTSITSDSIKNAPVPSGLTSNTTINTSVPTSTSSNHNSSTSNSQYKLSTTTSSIHQTEPNTSPTPSNLINRRDNIQPNNGSISELETRISAVESNVDYLTSLTSQLGFDPEHEEIALEGVAPTENDFLTYYGANFNPTENEHQMLYNLMGSTHGVDSSSSSHVSNQYLLSENKISSNNVNTSTPSTTGTTKAVSTASALESTTTMTQYVPPIQFPQQYLQQRTYLDDQVDEFADRASKRMKVTVEGKDEENELIIDDLLANLDDNDNPLLEFHE